MHLGKVVRIEKAMLKIDTIETDAAITLELHGRLIGPWVPLLETLWKSKEGRASGRTVVVDLTDVTGIDDAACYLLRLMEAKNVTLSGGGIGIRALLGDDKGGKQNEIR
jgi:anti-anti-sigma regulatory factor